MRAPAQILVFALFGAHILFSECILAQYAGLDQSGITYSGSACPAGSLTATIDRTDGGNEQSDLSLFLSSGVSVSTDGKSIGRKSCTVSLPLTMPRGFIAMPNSSRFMGRAKLDAGASAVISANISWAKPTDVVYHRPEGSVYTASTLAGPWDKAFDVISMSKERLESPCGVTVAKLVVEFVWEVAAKVGGKGFLSIDSRDGSTSKALAPFKFAVIDVGWDRCLR